MFRILYNLFICLFSGVLWVMQPFNHKIRLMVKGRRNQKVEPSDGSRRVICVHCASLGEFEQGRSLIEALRSKEPEARIVVTFFSPSGYEIRKNYSGADAVYYLPIDCSGAVRRFLDAVQPDEFYIVKYEYWYNLLRQLSERGCKVYLVSAIFREGSQFFAPSWKGGSFYRSMLGYFTRLYVQDEASRELLVGIGYGDKVVVAGDTRFDRVAELVESAKRIELVEEFVEGAEMVVVCGSTWGADEEMLVEVMRVRPEWRFVVVPHEIDGSRIESLIASSGRISTRYSSSMGLQHDSTLLVIDTIGLLSSIYRYGQIAYIGGGFGAGIHNTLEAATWGLPIVFGTRYVKFKEACDLVRLGAACSVGSVEEMKAAFDRYSVDYASYGEISREYVRSNIGATGRILG